MPPGGAAARDPAHHCSGAGPGRAHRVLARLCWTRFACARALIPCGREFGPWATAQGRSLSPTWGRGRNRQVTGAGPGPLCHPSCPLLPGGQASMGKHAARAISLAGEEAWPQAPCSPSRSTTPFQPPRSPGDVGTKAHLLPRGLCPAGWPRIPPLHTVCQVAGRAPDPAPNLERSLPRWTLDQ